MMFWQVTRRDHPCRVTQESVLDALLSIIILITPILNQLVGGSPRYYNPSIQQFFSSQVAECGS